MPGTGAPVPNDRFGNMMVKAARKVAVVYSERNASGPLRYASINGVVRHAMRKY